LHIPDGFLDTKTVIATSALSVAGVAVALRHFKAEDHPRKIPLLGLTAAFVFASQMLNFPVAGGTSGHLIGAVLTAILLGPSAAVIVITSVLVVQCFLFADGGVSALGANVFNMALVAPLVGYAIYAAMHKVYSGIRGTIVAASFASWCSAVIASVCCTGELALSGTVPWSTAFVAMTGVHALIGIGEGLITALVLAALYATRPELLRAEGETGRPGEAQTFFLYGLLVVIGLLLFVLPFASPLPDGLERVAKDLGFDYAAARQSALPAPFASYRFPGVSGGAASAIVSGVVGVVVVFVLSIGLSFVLFPRKGKTFQNRV